MGGCRCVFQARRMIVIVLFIPVGLAAVGPEFGPVEGSSKQLMLYSILYIVPALADAVLSHFRVC